MSDLRGRVKEWDCLHETSVLMARHDRPLDDILKDIVRIIPYGWRYPESTCARIVLREKEYFSPNFKETAWKQAADVLDSAQCVGVVEVYYLEEQQYADEGPFLKEERILIDELARQIGFLSELKRTVETLRESEKKYRTLFEDSRDPIVITTRGGGFVDVNQAALELFGYSREELEGMNILDLYDNAIYGNDFQKEIEKKGSLKDFRLNLRKKDGTRVDCLFNGTLRRDEDETILGYQGIIRDVTEQWRSREELERQLMQAQKMEAIGTLAGGIAHDFNNILGVIMGCTELSLLQSQEQNPIHPHLMQIYKAGTRARDLVQQILTVSRSTEQERKPVQPTVIIKEALKMLRASLPSTIQIQQNIQKDAGIILADPTQIHQILMNLCTNAAHAMRDRGGVLKVTLTNMVVGRSELQEYPHLKPGPYIRLIVADTGHGMDRKVMERIFEPYFTTKELGDGTGLGLAVAYGIVKSYHGTIKVHSAPGRGSIFQVLLPRVEYAEAARGREGPGILPKGNESILLVDDEEDLVQAMQEMLEFLGYRVTPKTSSRQALEAFQSRSDAYDLVITDHTMPYMTGVDLAKEIMAIRPGTPIVLCTGFSEQVNEEKAISWGIRAFLLKPIFIQQLAGTIRKVLDRENLHENKDSI